MLHGLASFASWSCRHLPGFSSGGIQELRLCWFRIGLESSLLIVLLIVLLLYIIISIVNCRVRFLNLLYNKKGITILDSHTMCCFSVSTEFRCHLLQAGLVLFQYNPSHRGYGANGGPQPERRWLGWFFFGI